MIKIVQCWDDGVEEDVRLCELLREYKARASFNLNPGLHEAVPRASWRYRGSKDVRRLAKGRLRATYEGFTVANHSATHPRATTIPLENWRREVVDARKELQDIFEQPVYGFVFPFNSYSPETAAVVRDAGHLYFRSTQGVSPSRFPLAFPADCHHADPDFWVHYEHAKSTGAPTFYFWGHSYEFLTEADWQAYTDKLARFNADPDVIWADLPDLFLQIQT